MPGIAGGLFFEGERFPQHLASSLGGALCRAKEDTPRSFHGGSAFLASVAVDPQQAAKKAATSTATGVSLVLDGEVYPRGEEGGSLDASDLLQLYLEKDRGFLLELNGRFALAVHDPRSKTLWVATDRLGTLPVHVVERPGGVLFSTAMSALLADADWQRDLDLHAAIEMLSFGCLQGDRTLFREVRVLEPGTILEGTRCGLRKETYWRLQDHFRPEQGGRLADQLEEARLAFNRGVALRCGGDPASLLLSGGLDSRTILSACAVEEIEAHAYTYGLPESDDVEMARAIADAAGARWLHLDVPTETCYCPGNLVAAARATGCMLSVAHSLGVSVVDTIRAEESTLLLGNGGEFVRGGIYDGLTDTPPRSREPAELARILARRFNVAFRLAEGHEVLRDDVYDSWRDAAASGIRDTLQDLEGLPPGDVLDAYFLLERARRYLNSGGPAFFGTRIFCHFPFYDATYIDRCLTLDRRLRSSSSRVLRHIIQRNSPQLAALPATFGLPVSSGPLRSEFLRRAAFVKRKIRKRLRLATPAPRSYFNIQEAFRAQEAAIREWFDDSRAVEVGLFDRAKLREFLKMPSTPARGKARRLGAALTIELFLREFVDDPSWVTKCPASRQEAGASL